MRRLLNTLYVTLPNSYLLKDGENIIIKAENKIKFRVPIHNLESIICFGYIGASPGLLKLCCDKGVALSFLTEYGQFMGRVTGKVCGNVLLRRTQYRWADKENPILRLARRFISAKIINSRSVLHRVLRDHSESINLELIKKLVCSLGSMPDRIKKASNLDTIRGIEGESAQLYFSGFNELILSQKNDFNMETRNRRPPTDRINALLSFLYVLLTHDVVAALESVGLDPQVGFLHKDRPGRPSLALDVMEELRPHIADRLAVTLINRNQIEANGFLVKENGAVIMDDNTRKEVLTNWQKRKKDVIVHPYLKEKIPIGLIPYVQSLLLARHIRGDLEDYPPFFWK